MSDLSSPNLLSTSSRNKGKNTDKDYNFTVKNDISAVDYKGRKRQPSDHNNSFTS